MDFDKAPKGLKINPNNASMLKKSLEGLFNGRKSP